MLTTYLTRQEVAEYMRVGKTLFGKLQKQPDFPCPSMIGDKAIWSVAEIDRYITSKKVGQVDAFVAGLLSRTRKGKTK